MYSPTHHKLSTRFGAKPVPRQVAEGVGHLRHPGRCHEPPAILEDPIPHPPAKRRAAGAEARRARPATPQGVFKRSARGVGNWVAQGKEYFNAVLVLGFL